MKFNIRVPTPDDDLDSMHSFDFTKMSAVNTCPTWGITRYGHHKVFGNASRAMALEAGSACHDVFAAGRLFDLFEYGHSIYGADKDIHTIVTQRAAKLFGEDRATVLLDEFRSGEDERTRLLRGGLGILESSGFYDDPSDRRRTLSNLEEACIVYLDRYEYGKNIPYINGDFVGVENAINLVVEYSFLSDAGEHVERVIRLTGRIDGVHCHRNDTSAPYIEENKTASRLGDAWEQSFEMSHQVTGYAAAASTMVGIPITMARIRGLCIPQPRSSLYDSAGLSTVTVFRKAHQFEEWAKWVMHTVEMYLKWIKDPTNAPKYTHSCNRYFRPCSYIPLCAASPDERLEIYNEMQEDEWSPLHEKSGD